MKLYPLKEIGWALKLWQEDGFDIYQQFLCSKCGTKQTIDVPNKLFVRGKCEECGHVTDILKDGCNYMAIGSADGKHKISQKNKP